MCWGKPFNFVLVVSIGRRYKIFLGIAYDYPDSGGHGGNTTTGEAARKVFGSKELRSRLTKLCPREQRRKYERLLFNDNVILRLTSCRYRVLVDKIGKHINVELC